MSLVTESDRKLIPDKIIFKPTKTVLIFPNFIYNDSKLVFSNEFDPNIG